MSETVVSRTLTDVPEGPSVLFREAERAGVDGLPAREHEQLRRNLRKPLAQPPTPLGHAVEAKRRSRLRKRSLARPPFGGIKTLEPPLFVPDNVLLNEADVEFSTAHTNTRAGGVRSVDVLGPRQI
eukprot:6027495-Heterocapsa_arctica.AAC.1